MRVLAFLFFTYSIYAQEPYHDYIGAGHDRGIVVTSSSDLSKEDWHDIASGDKTINGDGLNGPLSEASRFLSQSTFGFKENEMKKVANMGINSWIEEQLNMPMTSYVQSTDSIFKHLINFYIAQGENPDDLPSYPDWLQFRYAWWNNAVFAPDQLRERVAFALSQILVISDETDLSGNGFGLAAYYDVLTKHSFGNYKDLLLEVALHPTMGFYLSHLNNPREIPELNIHPDQNFAREIMQLFTIGLFELNLDGSKKLDDFGNAIPTYNNQDIVEMAKVFTGLGISTVYPEMGDLYFGRGIYGSDLTKPMIMYEEWHEKGVKHLINGVTIPDGQSGIKDIEDAVTMLFNHPNTGPFICRQLIQRLVTSNPSPAYLSRVASIFNDDGEGVRGNLKAVVKAILLDEEARDCAYMNDPEQGKLLEPTLRHSQFLKGIGFKAPAGIFLNNEYNFERRLLENPLSSPSVFNFYLPSFSPTGPLNDAGLVAPEFQLVNSLSALDYPNIVYEWTYYEYPAENWDYNNFPHYTNAVRLIEPALDDEVLINQIDMIFTHGNMSEETRNIIKEALNGIEYSIYGLRERINMALYLTLISPDYLIQK